MFKNFIGIDVSKSSFNFCVIDETDKTVRKGLCEMNEKGFNDFRQVLESFPLSIVVLESTGSYHINILSFIAGFKKEICLVNPVLIKRFIQTVSLRKTKTDEIDALSIAKFARVHHAELKNFVSSEFDEIRAIARIREDVAQDLAKAKTRLKQDVCTVFPELENKCDIFTQSILNLLSSFPTVESITKTNVRTIEKALKCARGRKTIFSAKEIKELAISSVGHSSKIMETVVRHDIETLLFLLERLEELTKCLVEEVEKNSRRHLQILTSVKGISEITASHFIAETGDISRFSTREKLIAFVGTDPAVKESGTSLNAKGRISKKGSKSLRRTVFLMAMGVMKYDHNFKEYYYKKRAQGMQHRKAMIALCNKLLRVLYAILKKDEIYVAA